MTVWNTIERATDWSLGLFSARRRALGQHFRRMESDTDYRDTFLALMNARGYRAAGIGNSTPFGGGNQTADREVLPDLSTLTARARELTRDDPIASGLRQTFERNVIGTGMVPQARTDSPEKNKVLEAYWARRKDLLFPAEDMPHGEAQSMIFGNAWETGNVFVKAAKQSESEPVWFEVIEKDRVSTPMGRAFSKDIVDGVQKDEWGRPVSYWVLKPGKDGMQDADYQQVPKDEIVHLRLANRPGQTHGVPACHAILQDLRDLDLLILASLKRVQIAACLSVFITTTKQLTDAFDVTAQKYGYKLDQTIEPGMIMKLFPEEQIQTVAPNFPSSEFDPFIVLLARRIGTALGVSWQIVLKDFSQSTYSSARTDLLEARQGYVVFQHWFRAKLLDWQWRKVMTDGMALGELPGITVEDIALVFWIPPGWRWIDPQNEVAATEMELRLNLTTLQEVCASQGKDWEETLRQRILEQKREQEMRTELGVEAPAVPAATGQALPRPPVAEPRPMSTARPKSWGAGG